MKSKKNAFTLIELLAIIVILAIIAVITVPIILNIIENSRRGAVKDSAYGYKDSINKWYVSKLSEDSNYNIPDDDYKTDELKNDFKISYSGQEPKTNSWVTIEKNNVIEGCLQFDEYKVEIKEEKINKVEKGECEELMVSQPDWFIYEAAETGKKIVGFSSIYNNLSTKPEKIIFPKKTPNGDTITEIGNGESIFGESDVSSIKSITIPSNIKKINDYAFYKNCTTNIEELNFKNGIEYIGKSSFQCIGDLQNVTFPQSMKILDNSSFSGIYSLSEVNFNEGLLKIEDHAFSGTSLAKITLPSTLEYLGYQSLGSSDKIINNYSNIYIDSSKIADYFGNPSGAVINNYGTYE